MPKQNKIEDQIKVEYNQLSDDAKKFLARVLQIEKEKLHQGKPKGVKDDLLKALNSIVK